MADHLLIKNEGPVRILRIQRPEVRNAVDSKTAKALREAWLAFDRDPDAKVAILTGGDEVFSAGADLADLSSLGAEVEGNNGPLGFTRPQAAVRQDRRSVYESLGNRLQEGLRIEARNGAEVIRSGVNWDSGDWARRITNDHG